MPEVEVTRRWGDALEFFVGEVRYVVTSRDPENYQVVVMFPSSRPDRNFRVLLNYRFEREPTGKRVRRLLDVEVEAPDHTAVGQTFRESIADA